MNLTDWVELVKSKLELNGRRIHFNVAPSNQVFINYFNFPESIKTEGAELENNRIMLTVKPVGEKLKVSVSVHSLHRACMLRGKTAAPEKVADYVASFFNNIAITVEPKFTHTKV
jgi:hypothetical protein